MGKEYNKNLLRRVDELELSVRSDRCLKDAGIIYVGGLVQLSAYRLCKTPNFGRKSFNEIRYVLAEMGIDWKVKFIGKKKINKLSKKYKAEIISRFGKTSVQ